MNGDKALGLDGFTMSFFSILLGYSKGRCYEGISLSPCSR